MIDLSKLEGAKSVEVTYFYPDTIDKQFIKDFRKEHDLTQNALAHILGVTKKAVEKWEQGAHNINSSTRNLLWLLDNNENLIEQFYSVKIIEADFAETIYTSSYSYNQNEEDIVAKECPIINKKALQKCFA